MANGLQNGPAVQRKSKDLAEGGQTQSIPALSSLRLHGTASRGAAAGEHPNASVEAQLPGPGQLGSTDFLIVHLKDTEGNRIVVFAKNAETSPQVQSFGYTYTPTSSGSNHVIQNLAPSSTYYVATSTASPTNVAVSKTNNGGLVVTTDQAGVLAFRTGTDGTARPAAPSRVRIG